MTSSVTGPRSSSKAFPKAKLAPKKGHGHCLVVYCQSDPLQLFESLGNHYTWEVCSGNRWDTLKLQCLQSTLVNRKGPILLHDNSWLQVIQPMLQNLNELDYEVLPHPPHSPEPTITSSSILTTFCRENVSTTSRKQKILLKSSSNPKACIFMLQK